MVHYNRFVAVEVLMIEKMTTKKLLAESFIDLARRNSINKITVSDIVANCGAGRQTFYNYFQSKYDLIYWICDEATDKILGEWIGKEPWGRSLGRVLLHMQTIRPFYIKAFHQSDYLQLYEHFYSYCAHYYERYLHSVCGVEIIDRELEFEIHYTSYACVNASRSWLEGAYHFSAEEMGTMLFHAMPPILKQYFRFSDP